MSSKLTLSIDAEVIDRAKQFAQHNKQSVSSLVENYLDRISTPQAAPAHSADAPITDGLVGMFAQDAQMIQAHSDAPDYKTLLAQAREEKWL